MEEKYSPLHIVNHVWGKFFALPEQRECKIEEYSVFIEIKYSKKECFLIKAGKDGFLWRGICSGTSWRAIKDAGELYDKRDFLGSVSIRFRNNPIKIENKILDSFPNYDLFWHYISK
jgi:hypothetical protein